MSFRNPDLSGYPESIFWIPHPSFAKASAGRQVRDDIKESMLQDRILLTLRFFDLKDFPLTLLELEKYLLPEAEELKKNLDEKYELASSPAKAPARISAGEILNCLENELGVWVKTGGGFYCLAGRTSIIQTRLENYTFGLKREKLLRKFAPFLQYLPFIRGVALAGSQPLGQQKPDSDIDLLIIVQPDFLWLGRTLVTAYFQVFGVRRHGEKIANRFCLNHYLGGPKAISSLKNLYTAAEYIKLRPLVFPQAILAFQEKNQNWLRYFFPNWQPGQREPQGQSRIQRLLEKWLSKNFGRGLEKNLKNWQLPKIRREEFIIVEEDELSFHPDSKQQSLLRQFFTSL